MLDFFKALSDENRLRIINLLIDGKKCVCEIETILGITQSNASRHLNKLKNSGIISSKKEAQWVFYEMNLNFLKENPLLIEYLKESFEKIDLFVKDKENLNKLSIDDFTCKSIILNKE